MPKKDKLFIHICCAGCGAYVAQKMSADHECALFYYNPNIYPSSEYEARAEEVRKTAAICELPLVMGEYDHERWLEMVRGLESCPERGGRCLLCYRDRIERTALTARERGFGFFTTTLTTSPHKDAKTIIALGRETAGKYGIIFLEEDFKKKDGFKKSSSMTDKYGLKRQNYCGCEYSLI